tara:strand:+ start:1016 stop:1525 length:510 start_codon:yes stop_codon:yes gene_type:complete
MVGAVKLFFKNYFNFTGRSSRSEYWWTILTFFIVCFVIALIEVIYIFTILFNDPYSALSILEYWYLRPSFIFSLAMSIGMLSLAARRLQDRGHSGWWQLANIIPGLLFIVSYLNILDSVITGGSINWSVLIAASTFGLISLGTGVAMTVFLCLPPTEDENKWGRNPLLD